MIAVSHWIVDPPHGAGEFFSRANRGPALRLQRVYHQPLFRGVAALLLGREKSLRLQPRHAAEAGGRWPMAMKTPSIGNSATLAVLTLRRRTPVTLSGSPVPTTSSSTVCHRTEIFGFLNSRSCRILSARKLSRRWTRVTLLAKLV